MNITVEVLDLVSWLAAHAFILLGLIFFISQVLRLWTRYYLRAFSAHSGSSVYVRGVLLISSSIREQKAICCGCMVLLARGTSEACMVALCKVNVLSSHKS